MLNRAMGCRIVVAAGAVLAPCLLSVPAASAASNICSKVSPSAVSAIVGHSVPAGVPSTQKIAGTKKNGGISVVEMTCTYGSLKSPSALGKVVILETETASKSLSYSLIKASLTKNGAESAGFKIQQYSGLGVPGVYFTENLSSIKAQGMAGFQGTKAFGADVFTAALPQSKLAQLAKLAANLG